MSTIMKHISRLGVLIFFAALVSPAAATNSADIGMTCGAQHDTIWEGYPATLDFYLENDVPVEELYLGYEIWSPDGAGWNWLSQPGGFGPSQYVTLIPGARLTPDCFDLTGFSVTEQNVDESGRDTILCFGVSFVQTMPSGPLEHMYSYHVEGITGTEEAKTLCVDSAFVPPSYPFVFVDASGFYIDPVTLWPNGGRCWPVKTLHAGDASGDNSLNVADAVYLIQYIFKGGPPPPNHIEGDVNGDCSINISDAVYLINYIFKDGDPPSANIECEW